MTGNERFMSTIHDFQFQRGLKDYSMNIKDLSNSNKISMVSSFCPMIT